MKYGFIGCGNMGSAIAKAVYSGCTDIAVTDRSGKAKALGFPYTTAEEIAAKADRIFLGVKPHMMANVLSTLKPILQERRPLLITMAAGLTMAQIDEMAGGGLPVIRIMPNTPTAIGCGVIQYCANSRVTEDVLTDWLRDMAPCGLVDALEEHLIDAASALSGSGPAYMYVFLEALADGAVACGIPRSKAYEYAAMTMEGAARLYLQTKEHPGALKDAVCSPGGSTIAGLKVLEEGAFRAAVMNCVTATCQRNKVLGK